MMAVVADIDLGRTFHMLIQTLSIIQSMYYSNTVMKESRISMKINRHSFHFVTFNKLWRLFTHYGLGNRPSHEAFF